MSKSTFTVVVAGGRDFKNYESLTKHLDIMLANVIKKYEVTIVSGGARGADALGARYAKDKGLNLKTMPADWDKFGKSAGYKRNQAMADCSDATVAVWDGESKGTKHMIDITKRKGNKLQMVKYIA